MMNNHHFLAVALVSAIVTAGCQTVDTGSGQPARIIDADDASRADLQEAVNMAFGTDVTIADYALTNSSVLIIERGPRPSMENPDPVGRNMERPVQLRLIIDEVDCILVDTRNNARYTLSNTSCEPE
jgi:hypothetical protein